MKKLVPTLSFLICVALLITSCKKTDEQPADTHDESTATASQAEESGNDLLIQSGIGVGKVKFGMTVEEMKDILGKPDVEVTGISYLYSSLGIEIVAKDKATISAIVCGNPENKTDPAVKALEQTCKFKTAEGIGIGSTEAQIIEAYGEPTSRRDHRLLYKDKHMFFSLDNGKLIGIWLLK